VVRYKKVEDASSTSLIKLWSGITEDLEDAYLDGY